MISVLVSPIIGAHVNCSDQGEPDTDTTKVLLDTNRYNSLLPSPWNSSTVSIVPHTSALSHSVHELSESTAILVQYIM